MPKRRPADLFTLLAAAAQGRQDFTLGLSPSANPYTFRPHREAYNAGYDAALLHSYLKKLERDEPAPVPMD